MFGELPYQNNLPGIIVVWPSERVGKKGQVHDRRIEEGRREGAPKPSAEERWLSLLRG